MTFCYINGSFEVKTNAMVSVEDRGFNFSDGVYEVLGFANQKILNFKKHLGRLDNSLRGIRISKPFINFKSLELIIKKLFKLNNINDGFIYLQITRGNAKRNHLFPTKIKPNIVIFTFNLNVDKKITSKGVEVGLTDDLRWSRCDIKSISLLPNVLEKQKAYEKGFYEYWQIRDNLVTEGSTSNAFIVNSRNQIITHPTNNFILGGVTRDSIIEIAKKEKIDVIEKGFSSTEINNCKEAFLTSTTVGVLPVVKIENKKINRGIPGIITKKLIEKYNNYLLNQIDK